MLLGEPVPPLRRAWYRGAPSKTNWAGRREKIDGKNQELTERERFLSPRSFLSALGMSVGWGTNLWGDTEGCTRLCARVTVTMEWKCCVHMFNPIGNDN